MAVAEATRRKALNLSECEEDYIRFGAMRA
mgnify:CR=1 FL=1